MYKLLLFHHYNSSMGAGLSLLHILQSMDRTQLDITVCLPKIPGDLDGKIKEMNIPVMYADCIIPYMHFSGGQAAFLSKRHLKNAYEVRRAKTAIADVITRVNPDIVAVNSMTLFWVGRVAGALGKKTVCFHRETYCKGLLGIRTCVMKKELSNCFDTVAFLSYYDLKQTPKGMARFVRVTDKVDVDTYQELDKARCRKELQLPEADKLILYAGGVAKLKGPMTILKAMKLVDDPDVKLVFLQYQPVELQGLKAKVKHHVKRLLGRNLQYDIERFVKENKLEDRVIFRPATDRVELYFCACDAVVFPSHNPHQARPAYEAGIAKKPIIITDFLHTREFVDHENGWLFDKDNAAALAQCVKETLGDLGQVKVEKNYTRVLENNDLRNMPQELFDLFEQLME